jgi:hypothetical protein
MMGGPGAEGGGMMGGPGMMGGQGGGMMGGQGGGQAGGGQGGGLGAEAGEAGDVVWVYELNYDKNYHVVPAQIVEITLDIDGIVKSVAIFGRRWGGAKTSKGVKLGDPWRFVMRVHGPPDEVEPKGKETIVYYREHNNLAFAFHENEKTQGREVTTIAITTPQ